MLRHQRVLEEYNKDLLTFAQGRETEFLKAAPELFGPKFPRDATEHLDQLAALRKAKSSSSGTGSSLGFQKPPSYQSNHQRYYAPRQRPQPYSQPAKGGGVHQEGNEGFQMTINRQFYCMLKVINCQSYTVESTRHGVQKSTKDNGVFYGGREAGFLCRCLEGVNRGSLGTEYHCRLSDSLKGGANAGSKTSRFSKEQEVLLRAEIDTLLQKGAILPQVHNPEGFYS